MKIFLMRHGEADFLTANDYDRELTQNGIKKVSLNVEKRQQDLSQVDLFVSSPLLRARQTANVAQTTLGKNFDIKIAEWLTPEASIQEAVNELGQLKFNSIALFSHQPFCSAFVEALCGLDAGYVSMGTANLVGMETDVVAAGIAELLWQET